jgi:hypothetical protein
MMPKPKLGFSLGCRSGTWVYLRTRLNATKTSFAVKVYVPVLEGLLRPKTRRPTGFTGR